jgi:hypothetical protein
VFFGELREPERRDSRGVVGVGWRSVVASDSSLERGGE